MKIGLIDVDGHNFPNLPLMKIAAYHKANGDEVEWHWETDGFEYDENLDAHIIPEGWWEYKHYNGDDEYNHPIDDTVTHWMPLPATPEEK